MTVDTSDRIALPERGGGERRTRRAQRKTRRRHSRRFLLLGLVALAAAVAVTLLVLQDRPSDSTDGELLPVAVEEPAPGTTESTAESPVAAGDTPRGLLVEQAADGRIAGVTVLAVDESGEGGHVVFLPAGTMVEVPSLGLEPLRDAHALGGLPLLQSSVENLLGVAFEQVSLVGPTQLAAALEPAGVLTVDVPARVEALSPEGRITVLWDAGPVAVAPGDAASLLEAPGQTSDLDRLVRHQRFWEAWLAMVARGGEDALPSRASVGGLRDLVAALALGEVRYEVLPVEALASGVAEEDDLWSVRGDELQALVERFAPDATPAESRIRVQVLNGTGDVGVARVVQPLLVPAGATVALTGNADRFDYPTTQVVFYDDADRASADAVRAALGVGEVVKSLTPLSVVDVTVVVGADLLQRQGA